MSGAISQASSHVHSNVHRRISSPEINQQRNTIFSLSSRGQKAYMHTIFALLFAFNYWGLGLAFGVYQEYYTNWKLVAVKSDQVAWIGSVQASLSFLLAYPICSAYDAGWHWRLKLGGCTLLIICQLLMILCNTWWKLFLVQGIMMGGAMGIITCSSLHVLISSWGESFGSAMNVGASGASIGGAVYTLILQQLLPRMGWTVTCCILASVMLLTLLFPAIFYRPGPQRAGRVTDRTLHLRAISFNDVPYLSISIGIFSIFLSIYIGFFYMIDFAVRGLLLYPLPGASFLLASLAASIPGRFLAILFSNRFLGPVNVLIPCTIAISVIFFALVGCTSSMQLFFLVTMFGFFSGGVQAVSPSVIETFCNDEAANYQETFMRQHWVFMFAIGLGILLGPFIGGRLVEDPGTWRDIPKVNSSGNSFSALWFFSGTTSSIASVCLLFAKILNVGLFSKERI